MAPVRAQPYRRPQHPKSRSTPFDILEKGMRFYAEKGLAVCEEGCWHLTPKGFLLSNRIIGGLLELQERSQPLTRRGR